MQKVSAPALRLRQRRQQHATGGTHHADSLAAVAKPAGATEPCLTLAERRARYLGPLPSPPLGHQTNAPMKPLLMSKKGIAGVAIAAVVAVLIVACGGSDSEVSSPTESKLSATNTQEGDARDAGAGGDRAPVSWSVASIADSANPGSSQLIPITLTANVNFPEAVRLRLTGSLRDVVTVSPASFPSLTKGQIATATITIAPSRAAPLRLLKGALRLTQREDDDNESAPGSLSISVNIVAPEIMNGITVPPEPPPELNNLTLAGIDANQNGVRDDVERVIAKQFGGTTDYPLVIAYAKQYQLRLTTPIPTQRASALAQVSQELCAVENESNAARRFDMRSLVANNLSRKQANRAFYDVLVGFIPEELPPCAK